jgi:predicted metal-dependent phosphoesterase TrpH
MDLHVHTCYSWDGVTTLKEVVVYAKKRGLDGVAITDHDSVKGAVKLAKKHDFLVMPGIEVSTKRGHVLALNVTTSITPKLSTFETIETIHDLGGIAVAAHPTTMYKGGLRRQTTSNFDAIEVINSSSFPFFLSTRLARRLAVNLNLPQTAGSDSHRPSDIGTAYTLIDADSEVDEVVHAIKKGATVPFGKPIPWKARFLDVMLNPKRRRLKKAYSRSSI